MRPTGSEVLSSIRFQTVVIIAFLLCVIPSLAGGAEKKPNRLIKEKSPYLLKHAYNPVDWYPWGEEAFRRAREEDRPVYLSIGYTACHWCNVMEEESFSDPEVAALMNGAFVSVKVDREERPDLDTVYMTVSQMLTGGGGWPLTIIMTPEKKPFFAGTYFPKHSRFGRMGMMELVPRVKELWEKDRVRLIQQAETITDNLRKVTTHEKGSGLEEKHIHGAFERLKKNYDARYGGFGTGVKFPSPHTILFLLRYWHRTGNDDALKMARGTLKGMRHGGIFDHLGFGFHRYSTDRAWLVPHFEKMLYDQALHGMAYTDAYQATGDQWFGGVAEEVFTFVLRDLTAPGGGFYAALDADSEGEEGKFYLWEEKEIRAALGTRQAEEAARMLRVNPEGNYVDPLAGGRTGRNILHTREGTSLPEDTRQKLYLAREKRVHPVMDDKILADWNGLMIASLARGARVLDRPGYLRAAERAAAFVLGNMRDERGRLLHRWREGEAAVRANAGDYAYLIWGLIELYESTFDVRYLAEARTLMNDFVTHFWDEGGGGFYFTPDYGENLLVRTKDVDDGALPSTNSVAMLNLLRLGRLTGDHVLEEKAGQIARSFSKTVGQYPHAHTMLMSALSFALGPAHEVVIVGNPGADDTEEMLKALRRAYLPNKVVLLSSGEGAEILQYAAYARNMRMKKGKATAYVCKEFQCELPVTEAGVMLRLLGDRKVNQ
jgi:uncharacterized protein YyaL (SSP411 family)